MMAGKPPEPLHCDDDHDYDHEMATARIAPEPFPFHIGGIRVGSALLDLRLVRDFPGLSSGGFSVLSDNHSPTVLLSSVCRPFGERYGDGFGVSYEGTHQIMWAQGIFRPRAVTTQ